jgi:hypothetical protein
MSIRRTTTQYLTFQKKRRLLIRSHKSKNRKHNVKTNRKQKTNNTQENTTQKTKELETCFKRVWSSWTTIGTRQVDTTKSCIKSCKKKDEFWLLLIQTEYILGHLRNPQYEIHRLCITLLEQFVLCLNSFDANYFYIQVEAGCNIQTSVIL